MKKEVERVLKKYNYAQFSIIQILSEIQEHSNYLPREILEELSEKLKIPFSKIYSIASFYTNFSLKPRGKHLILVCKGTACFVKGAYHVIERIEERFGIKAGETTRDGLFTLETVNCLGACALAPVIVVDGNYHGKASVQNVDTILDQYQKEQESIPVG